MTPTQSTAPGIELLRDDGVQPFQIERSSVRGRMVRLGPVLDDILSAHDYPEPAARAVSEMVVLAGLLASMLKYDGIFTLQTKGDGPIPMAVADVTGSGGVRAYARVDKTALAARKGDRVIDLFGSGYIAFTVDQGAHTQRYQGIVDLSGDSLTDCLVHYFRQSEQLQAGFLTAIDKDASGHWRGGGILLQRLPGEGGTSVTDPETDPEEGWNRAMVLLASTTREEMLSPTLAPADLLYRLFHEDGVRVYDASPLAKRCSCSAEKLIGTLRTLPRDELAEIYKETGKLEMVCEFCNTVYRLSEADIHSLIG